MNALLRLGGQVTTIGVLILAFSTPAPAQVTTGTLYGRVVDPSGAVVPEAAVIATNVLTSTTKATVTNGRGQYTIPFLTVGTYTVTIEAPGFKTRVEDGLEISSGQKITITSELEIGALQEVITVVTETPLLNMASAEQDIHVTSAMVKELPVNRRQITQLLNTGPGTNAVGNVMSINGLPVFGFTFTVDGVDATSDSELPSLGLYGGYNYIKGVSMEAVKEVEVSKNIFSAEIGMTVSGNVNIITKGGTNQLHGSTFWNYQSGGLNARNHFTAEKVSEVFHQFGASLGGPVVRDRLFFFGAFEGYRLTKMEPMSGFVPSRWIRDATIAATPASRAYFDLWPLPTGAEEAGDATAFYAGSHAATRDDNHVVARLDYNLSPSDYLSARYTRGRPNRLSPRLAIGNPRDFRGEVENVAFTWTKVLGPTTTSELRFGWNKNSTDRVDRIWEAGIPAIEDVLPGTDGEIFIKSGSNWSLENTWALVRGRHSFKFGALARVWRASRINEDVPWYDYANVEDLLANQAHQAGFSFGIEEFQIRSWDAGVFVQDDVRVTPSLMLNLGLRWDYSAVPRERDRRFFNRDGPFGGADQGSGVVQYRDPDSVWNANYKMISPRVGLAWSLDERTVLRGGAGFFYIPFNLFSGPVEIVQNALGEPGYIDLDGSALDELGIRYPDGNDAVKPLVDGRSECDPVALTCPTTGFISETSIDPDRENPYTIQWTLGLSRQLTDTVAFDVAYVGNHGVKLTYSPSINRIDRVSGRRPVAGFGGFRITLRRTRASTTASRPRSGGASRTTSGSASTTPMRAICPTGAASSPAAPAPWVLRTWTTSPRIEAPHRISTGIASLGISSTSCPWAGRLSSGAGRSGVSSRSAPGIRCGSLRGTRPPGPDPTTSVTGLRTRFATTGARLLTTARINTSTRHRTSWCPETRSADRRCARGPWAGSPSSDRDTGRSTCRFRRTSGSSAPGCSSASISSTCSITRTSSTSRNAPTETASDRSPPSSPAG